jgi:chromosome segregation ATPase
LKFQIAELKKKNEEWKFRNLVAQGDIKILKRERDAKEEEIQECQKKVKEAREREEKFKDGLASADLSIQALNGKIKGLEQSGHAMYNTGKQVMATMGEWKKKYEERTQELQEAVQNYKKLKLEGALERQKREKFHSQEKQKDKECIERYEKSLAQLTGAHEDQMSHLAEQIGQLEDDLKQHKLVLEVSQQEVARWKVAFYKMLIVSNTVLDELPRVAEVELPLNSVPSGIREFVGYCRAVLTAYKNIVRRAKKRL